MVLLMIAVLFVVDMVRTAGLLSLSRLLSTAGVSVLAKAKPRASGHTVNESFHLIQLR